MLKPVILQDLKRIINTISGSYEPKNQEFKEKASV